MVIPEPSPAWSSCFLVSPSSHPLHQFGGAPLVHGLGGNAELPEAKLSQPELQVLWDFPPLCQNLFQPLFGHLGEPEVADGRVVVVHDLAEAGGRGVALCARRYSVLAGIQKPPVVTISDWKRLRRRKMMS